MAKYLTTRFGKLKDARKPILGKWSASPNIAKDHFHVVIQC